MLLQKNAATAVGFDEQYPLSRIIDPSPITRAPLRPKEINLRLLRELRLSDNTDGVTIPKDGQQIIAIFYGLTLVYRESKDFANGREIKTNTDGYQFYQTMFHVSAAFRNVVRMVHEPNGCETIFFPTQEVYEILLGHPQFMELRQKERFILVRSERNPLKVYFDRVLDAV